MTDPDLYPLPGPDPGACPDCGGWRKAGMVHHCVQLEVHSMPLLPGLATIMRNLGARKAQGRREQLRVARLCGYEAEVRARHDLEDRLDAEVDRMFLEGFHP